MADMLKPLANNRKRKASPSGPDGPNTPAALTPSAAQLEGVGEALAPAATAPEENDNPPEAPAVNNGQHVGDKPVDGNAIQASAKEG